MQRIADELEKLSRNKQLRSIPDIDSKSDGKIVVNGIEYVNFASNDYLGLSTKDELRNEFLDKFKYLPLSSASARLLTGSYPEYKELEKTVADMYGKEAGLIFNTGYQANLGIMSALIGNDDVVFSDKLNHASIIDGMLLSKGKYFRYKHLDYENLESLLKKHRADYKRALLVTESVFSMDGDTADIGRLIELKKKYNCLLAVDEAHAFCACGDTLSGICDKNDVDLIIATFGKAVGSFGAFCVSNDLIISYLINKARSFIFSTSIPPINIAWSNWLLTEKRDYLLCQKQKLEKLTKAVHASLKLRGIDTLSKTQIVPIIIGDNEDTIKVSEELRSKGYYIPAVRPPTVPNGTSRLRISLTSDSKLEDFEDVLNIVQSYLKMI